MATLPTGDTPKIDVDGLVKGTGVTVNQTIQAVQRNEPIFGVGSNILQGYVALKMYDQISASVIGAGGVGGEYEIAVGDSYASGKPYVMHDTTFATNVVHAQ